MFFFVSDVYRATADTAVGGAAGIVSCVHGRWGCCREAVYGWQACARHLISARCYVALLVFSYCTAIVFVIVFAEGVGGAPAGLFGIVFGFVLDVFYGQCACGKAVFAILHGLVGAADNTTN